MEMKDSDGAFLPWSMVHTEDGGFSVCGMKFATYSDLIRHLATRHLVMWLSFSCPWCDALGFEKTKITRHVASCKSMPEKVIAMVKSVEAGDGADIINHHIAEAMEDLKRVDAKDKFYQLQRRVTLIMTRAEAEFRAYAESSNKKAGKRRLGKALKPTDLGWADETGLYCMKAGKYPHFSKCTSCEQILPDTQFATEKHLIECDVRGFASFHSQKILDDPLVGKVDKKIFEFKKIAMNRAEEVKKVPAVLCTVDGFGSSGSKYEGQKTLSEFCEDQFSNRNDGKKIHYGTMSFKNEKNEVYAKVKLVHEVNQASLKKELVEKSYKMPLFVKAVRKKGLKHDLVWNADQKCGRKSEPSELFGTLWKNQR